MLPGSAKLDLTFQALADPGRRSMLERLSRGPASVTQLAQPLTMTLSAVTQHLRVLEAAGLVTSRKTGRVRSCTLDTAALSLAERWINDRRTQWEQRLDRLEAFLEQTQDEDPS